MVKKGQVRPLAFVGLLVTRPIVMVERPQRREVQQWEFDDPRIRLDMVFERIMLPVPDLLHEQYIAVLHLMFAELVQVLLQHDKMVFYVEPVGELARAHQRLMDRLGLAVADNQHSGSVSRHRWRRRRVSAAELVQPDSANSEVCTVETLEVECEIDRVFALATQRRRNIEIDQGRSGRERLSTKLMPGPELS